MGSVYGTHLGAFFRPRLDRAHNERDTLAINLSDLSGSNQPIKRTSLSIRERCASHSSTPTGQSSAQSLSRYTSQGSQCDRSHRGLAVPLQAYLIQLFWAGRVQSRPSTRTLIPAMSGLASK